MKYHGKELKWRRRKKKKENIQQWNKRNRTMKAETDNQQAEEIKGFNIKGIIFVLGKLFKQLTD